MNVRRIHSTPPHRAFRQGRCHAQRPLLDRTARLRVRVYRKIGSTTRGAPLYVHGGGMIVSCIEDYDARCMHYCTNTDFVVRGLPARTGVSYPAQRRCAQRPWMHASTKEFGWDRARIGICGDSAGGGSPQVPS